MGTTPPRVERLLVRRPRMGLAVVLRLCLCLCVCTHIASPHRSREAPDQLRRRQLIFARCLLRSDRAPRREAGEEYGDDGHAHCDGVASKIKSALALPFALPLAHGVAPRRRVEEERRDGTGAAG
ncbi:hypothetical protein M885DRAFT_536502 [Pelagophyceae sp. CCMP2097]|nr:hypothetical protein M885DRAFT_536502 [Pelagophyceae sp. CCMP2097]